MYKYCFFDYSYIQEKYYLISVFAVFKMGRIKSSAYYTRGVESL